MTGCRNCRAATTLPLDWCADCWLMLVRGFLGGVGPAIAGHLISGLMGH